MQYKVLQSRGSGYLCEQMLMIRVKFLYRTVQDCALGFYHPGSPIQGQKETGSRIRIRNIKLIGASTPTPADSPKGV
jgi:hypothetical protein